MIYKTLHKKPKDLSTRAPLKPGENSGAPEVLAVPVPLVTIQEYKQKEDTYKCLCKTIQNTNVH